MICPWPCNPVTAEAKDANHLYSALTHLNLLSSTRWFLTKEEDLDATTLFCHKLECDSTQCSSAVAMTVMIQTNLEWTLSCMGHLIDKSHPALSNQPLTTNTTKRRRRINSARSLQVVHRKQ